MYTEKNGALLASRLGALGVVVELGTVGELRREALARLVLLLLVLLACGTVGGSLLRVSPFRFASFSVEAGTAGMAAGKKRASFTDGSLSSCSWLF